MNPRMNIRRIRRTLTALFACLALAAGATALAGPYEHGPGHGKGQKGEDQASPAAEGIADGEHDRPGDPSQNRPQPLPQAADRWRFSLTVVAERAAHEKAADDLKKAVAKEHHGPRRLALVVKGLAQSQQDTEEVLLGPSAPWEEVHQVAQQGSSRWRLPANGAFIVDQCEAKAAILACQRDPLFAIARAPQYDHSAAAAAHGQVGTAVRVAVGVIEVSGRRIAVIVLSITCFCGTWID